MRRTAIFMAMTALLLLTAGCTALLGGERADLTNDGVFEIRIETDKTEYAQDEAVDCHATVKYVGGADSITIYSADPLVGFGVKGGRFDGSYVVSDVLKSTTFKKGEEVRFDYVKTGGFALEDADAAFWESWFAEPSLKLPAGKYDISATISGFFDPDDYAGTAYTLSVSTAVNVTP
jgi:hypothetical protein